MGKLGIREAIQRDMERDMIRKEAEANGQVTEDDMEEDDAVPELLPKHFEEAVRQARRSVSDRDLAQYSSFAQNLQQLELTLLLGVDLLLDLHSPIDQVGLAHQAEPLQLLMMTKRTCIVNTCLYFYF